MITKQEARSVVLLLAAMAAMLAAAVASIMICGIPEAHAEPGVNDIVCSQSALGETPGQIAEQLHRGDPRYSIWDTGQTVWNALGSCDD